MSSSRLAFAAGAGLGLILPIVLILLLARVLTAAYNGLDGDGTYGIAVAGTRELAAAIDRYRGQYHHIPDEREGLSKLAPEFLPSVDTDPWGHPYIYDRSGPDWADVLSYGADGRPGGGGANSDISARFGRLGPHPPSILRSFVTVLLVGLALVAALPAVPWCDGVLAGMSAFWGGLVLVMFSGSTQSLLAPLSGILGVLGFAGAIALARELPYARLGSFLIIVAAYALAYDLLNG
ncbi:type II secretion system protein GspG [bacterium]|nr:type II secretion system protein GspG [bacterium]